MKSLNRGDLLFTGWAPCGPKIEECDVSFCGKPALHFSVDRGDVEIGLLGRLIEDIETESLEARRIPGPDLGAEDPIRRKRTVSI